MCWFLINLSLNRMIWAHAFWAIQQKVDEPEKFDAFAWYEAVWAGGGGDRAIFDAAWDLFCKEANQEDWRAATPWQPYQVRLPPVCSS